MDRDNARDEEQPRRHRWIWWVGAVLVLLAVPLLYVASYGLAWANLDHRWECEQKHNRDAMPERYFDDTGQLHRLYKPVLLVFLGSEALPDILRLSYPDWCHEIMYGHETNCMCHVP